MGDLLAATDLPRLASLMWEYRSGFDRLHFLLETQMLLISNGRDDQLHHMVDLLEEANNRMSRLDLEREILLGIDDAGQSASLRQVVEISEAPWDEILGEHADAIEIAVIKTKALVERSNLLVRRVQSALPDIGTLLSGGTAPSASTAAGATYGRSGRNDASGVAEPYIFENRI